MGCTFRGKLYGTNWLSRSISRTHGCDSINSRSVSLWFLHFFLPRLQLWHLDWLLCFQSVGKSATVVETCCRLDDLDQSNAARISSCQQLRDYYIHRGFNASCCVRTVLSVTVSSQVITVLQRVSWAHTKKALYSHDTQQCWKLCEPFDRDVSKVWKAQYIGCITFCLISRVGNQREGLAWIYCHPPHSFSLLSNFLIFVT